jgi:cell volume regulation protein A
MRIPEGLKSVLTIETTLTDILVIVTAVTVMGMISTGTMDLTQAFGALAYAIIVGLLIAVIGAFAWLSVESAVERRVHSHFLAFAILLLLYVLTEALGGFGMLTALIFGLELGNISLLRQVARLPDDVVFTKTEREFHSELNFFIRTFFFVYLGVIFSFSDLLPIAIGAVLVAVFLAMRIISSRLALIGSGLAEAEKNLTAVLMSRGLTAAVVAQMPAAALAAVAITEPAKGIIASIPQITLSVIFLSIAVTVAGVYFVSKPMNGEAPEAKRTGPAKAKKA